MAMNGHCDYDNYEPGGAAEIRSTAQGARPGDRSARPGDRSARPGDRSARPGDRSDGAGQAAKANGPREMGAGQQCLSIKSALVSAPHSYITSNGKCQIWNEAGTTTTWPEKQRFISTRARVT
jgi:hypothetical protein